MNPNEPPTVEPVDDLAAPRARRKLRAQPRNPVRPETRLSVTGRPAEVAAKLGAIAEVREALKMGTIGQREASLRLSRAFRGPATWAEACSAYLATCRPAWARKAASIWENRLALAFAKLRIWEADDQALRAWERAELGRGMSPKTQKCSWELLKTIGRRAVAAGMCEAVPWIEYRPAPVPRGLRREACTSLAELQALVLAARARDVRARAGGAAGDLALRILIVALCGLRQGEAAGLAWDAVELDTEPPIMRIDFAARDQWASHAPTATRPPDPPKDGRRVLALHPSAARALRAHREDMQRRGSWRPAGPVFPRSAGGGWRSHAEVIDPSTFRAVVAAAGLPRVEKWAPHSLRHTFATLELASGGDQRSTMDRTGHSSVAMLQHYLHAAGRGLPASAIPLLGPSTLDAVGAGETRPPPPGADILAELVDGAAEAARARDDDRAEGRRVRALARRRRHGGRGRLPVVLELAELAREWVTAGGGARRPVAITAHAERHYRRAYLEAQRAGGSVDDARAAGGGARRAFLASWTAAIAAVEAAP